MMERLTTLCEMSYRVAPCHLKNLAVRLGVNGLGGTALGGTRSRMNSSGKRKVSRALHQAVTRQGERIRTDLNRLMACLNEAKKGNM